MRVCKNLVGQCHRADVLVLDAVDQNGEHEVCVLIVVWATFEEAFVHHSETPAIRKRQEEGTKESNEETELFDKLHDATRCSGIHGIDIRRDIGKTLEQMREGYQDSVVATHDHVTQGHNQSIAHICCPGDRRCL